MSGGVRRDREELAAVVDGLSVEELKAVALAAGARHADVERGLRLAAARASGDLVELRREVDRGLRTRRYLGYRQSREWAFEAQPIVDELRVAAARPSNALVLLLERAVGHVVNVILHADDSDGAIGDLAHQLLELHATVCDSAVVEPVKLAGWMVRFSCEDQDFFEVDPVRYAAALGEPGLAEYRRLIAQRSEREGETQFAVRWARERLAVLDGDVGAIVELLGGGLRETHQFIRVCEAMAELGRDDDVLALARRGIDETTGWQVVKLYDFACAVHERRGAALEQLALRREQHERMASASSYASLRRAADSAGVWQVERNEARRALRDRDRGGLIDALLDEGDPNAAWKAATTEPAWDPGLGRRKRLAEAREPTHPGEALAWYLLIANEELLEAGRASYARAITTLKQARRAAAAAGQSEVFDVALADLRERYYRRRTFVAMLGKAGVA